MYNSITTNNLNRAQEREGERKCKKKSPIN